jgi:hypothetical protein
LKYWWVNQGQTYKKEFSGGYLWSPQVDANGAFNYSYQTMTLVEPGDVIFSFAESKILAIGVAQRKAYLGPKPEFGNVVNNWDSKGWYVDVEFSILEESFHPKSYLDKLLPHLPEKYSPLLKNGNGNQKLYLVDISYEIAEILFSGAQTNIYEIMHKCSPVINPNSEYEVRLEISARGVVGNTVQEQLIRARRGQGVFRHNVRSIENYCRVTMVNDSRHLVASHIKPWRDSSDQERLDGNNGLMLSPHVDHLFDSGYISFENSGKILVSDSLKREILAKWSISDLQEVGSFNSIQSEFLNYHRENVFIAR